MNKNIGNIIMIIIILVSIVVGFLSFNIKSSKNEPITTSTTTTSKLDEEISKEKDAKIIINGEEKIIKVKTYEAYDLFTMEYDTSFEMNKLSNNTYILKNKEDENIYITIEPVDYETIQNNNQDENVLYKYGEKKYLKITKYLNELNDLGEMNIKIQYMIDSIHVN